MEKREKSSKKLILVFLLPFLIWTILLFISPMAIQENSVKDLSGYTAINDNQDKIKNMSTPWNLVYSTGDKMCHQKAERSFFINGNQMPFCSRCVAIFLGVTIGLGFMIFYKIKLDEKFLFLLIASIAPMGIDGVGQLIGLWESTNITRVITGLAVGVFCGIAISVIIDEIKEMFVSKKTQNN